MKSLQYLEEHRMEIENRIKNIIWTISGDYSIDIRPDLETFARMENAAIYDGIKQGGLHKFCDRGALSMYLIKKIYCHALEGSLMAIAQLCIDEAVGSSLDKERKGIRGIRRKAYEEILEKDFIPLSATPLGRFKATYFREALDGSTACTRQIREWLDLLHTINGIHDTNEIIRVVDTLYNKIVEPNFETKYNTFEEVMSLTIEDMQDFSWQDYLDEEAREHAFDAYLDHITESMTALNTSENWDEDTGDKEARSQRIIVDPKALAKMYSYVEKNYGRSYLSESEIKRRNYLLCRGIHDQCSVYFTEGILKNPVLVNYQHEYARKSAARNREAYRYELRVIKQNIQVLTSLLKQALILRDEEEVFRADHGQIKPAELWKIGRTKDPRFFEKHVKSSALDFVVDILIDASGSQRKRQTQVILQAYIISEALSNLEIPFRVMSFCTFWDYTVMHRMRDYEDGHEANQNLFEYTTSSNNRDGLAIKAAGLDLLEREEEHKIMIILSDGKPNDMLVQRGQGRQPKAYEGSRAVQDTGIEVRKLRNLGVSVLGVFVGEEAELAAERKIFGKDFAYIRTMKGFSNIVGRYLLKHIEE